MLCDVGRDVRRNFSAAPRQKEKNTLSCCRADRRVGQAGFSEVSHAVPARGARTHFHLLFFMQTSGFTPCFSYLRPSTLYGRGPCPLFFFFFFALFCFLAGTQSEDNLFPPLISLPLAFVIAQFASERISQGWRCTRLHKEMPKIWLAKKKNGTHLPRTVQEPSLSSEQISQK